MKTILRGVRLGLATILQGITLVGFFLLAVPPWICCGRLYLLPIALVLSPLMLIGAALMLFCGPLANLIYYGLYQEEAKTGRLLDTGVEVFDPVQSCASVVSWAELDRITSIAFPLATEHRLEFKTGSRMVLASIDIQNNEPLVPWVGRDEPLSWLDVEDS